MIETDPPPPDFRRYLGFLGRAGLFLLFFIAVSALPGYLYHRQLQGIGEGIGPRRIARVSEGEPALWASGFYDSAIHKPEVARELEPGIAVVGSSRVMQWRRELFDLPEDTTFYNLGGGARDTAEARRCVRVLLDQDKPPALVILGVDWWWLQHPAPVTDTPGTAHRLIRAWRTARARTLDRVQLYQQAWRDSRVWHAWRHPDVMTPTGRRPWGINARTTGGFRNDGSYSYWHFVGDVQSPRHTDRAKRSEGLTRIDRGDYAGATVYPGPLADLRGAVKALRSAGCEVIVVLPPLEPGVLDHWRGRPNTALFLDTLHHDLDELCRQLGAGFADYTDPRPLGYGIDHFIDWFHGGERVYAAMLLDMARRPQLQRRLGPYVDPARLNAELQQAPTPYTIYPG